jgi:hypothetical protein
LAHKKLLSQHSIQELSNEERNLEEVVNAKILKPGRRICASGNAGAPQRLLAVLPADENIQVFLI